jgi:S-adenosylmethionine hydrolase
VHGAILSIAPSATVVDLTHAVPPQNVFAGAFLLWTAVSAFPSGSVHLAVVDPGVGSVRRPIAIRSLRGDVLVGPDNGLLVPALARLGGVDAAVALTRRDFWRSQTSATFHGRDIFGPVAAHLASGVALSDVGEPVTDLVQLSLPTPRGFDGEVLYVDTYGNLVTNLAASALPAAFSVRVGGREVPFAPFYAAVAPGELLALVGSAGLLEISARDASAAAILGAQQGAPVSLLPQQERC